MTQVSLIHLEKEYSPEHKALDALSLELPSGQITALLGPSGSGKTTCLKMIAGLTTPTRGDVCFDGESVLQQPAERRGAVLVFQNQALFPFLTIGENVAFGLKMRGASSAEIRRKVSQMLERVELRGLENRKPSQLSGGQQQRAALARALVVEPRVLLLDEPFSSLDARLRDEMRDLVRELQREKGITIVMVTHDREDAAMLADQIAVIFQGVLQQVDVPRAFYERPANVQVAAFFGTRNILPGTGTSAGVQTVLGVLRVERNGWHAGPVNLVIRPEHIQLMDERSEFDNTFEGRVSTCVYAGTRTHLRVCCGEVALEVDLPPTATNVRQGEHVTLHLPSDKLWVIPRSEERVANS